jgi:hypothetical protein
LEEDINFLLVSPLIPHYGILNVLFFRIQGNVVHRLLILIYKKDGDIQVVQNTIRNLMDLEKKLHMYLNMMPLPHYLFHGVLHYNLTGFIFKRINQFVLNVINFLLKYVVIDGEDVTSFP